MLKNSEELRKAYVERARGGEGIIEQHHFFNTGEMISKNVTFLAKVVLNPGVTVGYHQHQEDEEIYYVLKGKATLNDNGILKEIGPGMVAITGGGESHSLVNNGNEPCEYLALVVKN